jgi:hypothetical protein
VLYAFSTQVIFFEEVELSKFRDKEYQDLYRPFFQGKFHMISIY